MYECWGHRRHFWLSILFLFAQWPPAGSHVPGPREVNVCLTGMPESLFWPSLRCFTEGSTWDSYPMTWPPCPLLYKSCGLRSGWGGEQGWRVDARAVRTTAPVSKSPWVRLRGNGVACSFFGLKPPSRLEDTLPTLLHLLAIRNCKQRFFYTFKDTRLGKQSFYVLSLSGIWLLKKVESSQF